MIRLAVPSIEDDDLEAVRAVLQAGWLVQGAHVSRFEDALRAHTGTRHVVAVSSGTAALHVALLALGIGPGDLVLVTSYSWPATANAIEFCGATPVFVDIDGSTFNIDPSGLEARVEALMSAEDTRHRVKAILPVHAFGRMADMARITEVAGRFGLPVVEDAACALGARVDGRPAGAWGRVAAFSFHPRKAITTGEGGAIATDEDAIARSARALRNHGLEPGAPSPDFVMPGLNYRMTEFQAALGVTQCAKLARVVERRRALAAAYDRLLSGSPVQAPATVADQDPVFQSYVCLLPEAAARRRADLIATLRSQGIETTIGTWHIPLTTFYQRRYGFAAGDFPVTDDVFARALALPIHEHLTEAEQAHVVRALLALVG